MNRVFGVELSGRNGRYCTLDLPATDYELLDALERPQMKPGGKPDWEMIEHNGFRFLHAHFVGECDLYQLNALAIRLGQMDSRDKIAFEGLFNMEVDKKYGPISIATMIDLAYSTDCCDVVEGVTTDVQLGVFYAENGFMPELDALPDSVFQMLDFEKLGKKMRAEEGGILVNRGYVTQHTELKQVYDRLILVPKMPDYVFRLRIGRYPFDAGGEPEMQTYLNLPASPDVLAEALEECGAASWTEVVFQAEDSAIPGLLENADWDDIGEINELAQAIQYRESRGELFKLKAVLHAVDFCDIRTAVSIAENLDDYVYEPALRTAEEAAMAKLRGAVDEPTLSILQKYVNLFDYGKELIAAGHAGMTPYGLVGRLDGDVIQTPQDISTREGMQMQ